MRKATVTVTWMDGTQEAYEGIDGVMVKDRDLVLDDAGWARELPGGIRRQVPLENVRVYRVELQ